MAEGEEVSPEMFWCVLVETASDMFVWFCANYCPFCWRFLLRADLLRLESDTYFWAERYWWRDDSIISTDITFFSAS